MEDIICKGCDSDLAKGIRIPIHMTQGVLYFTCPLCNYESRLTVDDEGKLHLVNKFNPTKIGDNKKSIR